MRQHLKERGMNVDLYPFAGIKEDVARFPMYNFAGQMTGYIQYMPDGKKKAPNDEKYGKYHTFIAQGQISVFGYESIDFSRDIYLVGGMFKAATLNRLGYTALHVSGVSYRTLLPQLRLLQRRYFAIGDADAEGAQFARRFGGWQSPVDCDEMSDEDIHGMIYYETNTLADYQL